MPEIKMEDYKEAVQRNLGWCPDCKDFTGDMCEPDVENRDCPDCGESIVVGAELAMVRMDFDIEEDNAD